MAVMGYTALADVDVARYNAKVRLQAAALVIHPQFFEQENVEGKTRQAVFTIFDKLTSTPSGTLLTGTYDLTDPTPETMTDSQVTVTAYEKGNAVAAMQGVRETAILDVVAAMQMAIAVNMAESLDNEAAYRLYSALTATKTLAGPMTPAEVLVIARTLENNSVPVRDGGLHAAVISPYTKHDLFSDVSNLIGFLPVAQYTNPALAFGYELGAWRGFRWVSGPSAYHATVTGQRHDYPIFFGAGAFGQANGYDPEIVINNGTRDLLQRVLEIGWKAQRGYGVINSNHVIQYDVIPNQ